MSDQDHSLEAIFEAGGEMGKRMRELHWEDTPVGGMESWPQSLRSALSICLNTPFPICIYWGPEYVLLYNEAWSAIPGDKHPWALGKTARKVWPEIWDFLEEVFKRAIVRGEATWKEDALLPMFRRGYVEECYFNYTLSPIRGEEGAVVGIFNAVIETTYRVVAERRSRLLRTLVEGLAAVRSAEEACSLGAELLGAGREDVPFCLLYLLDPDGRRAHLAGIAGVATGTPAARPVIGLVGDGEEGAPWPLRRVLETREAIVVGNLEAKFGGPGMVPGGAWSEPVSSAVVLPVMVSHHAEMPIGFLVLGINPRRKFDETYCLFAESAADGVGTAIANAQAYGEERQKTEARYARSLIEASLDPFVTISASGKITDLNEATVWLTGVSRTELIGSDFADYFTEPERARAVYREVFSRGSVTDYLLAIRHREGHISDVIYNASLYHDEKGRVAGVFASARDVTARRKAEGEARALNVELERRVEERTQALKAANKELEAFSYSVSHDLRAPLRIVDGFSRMVLEDCAEKLDVEGRENLNTVRAASQRMGQLIDDMLRLSRITRGEMHCGPVNLSALAEEVAQGLGKGEPERNVEWSIEPGLVAEGDVHLVRIALENLLCNAWKFTGKRPDARIEFGRTRHGGPEGGEGGEKGMAYVVRDNGVGFDMTYAGKLFGAFQRLHSAAEFPGTGVGLATVQRIVHRHGGRVWAEGEAGRGAAVYFTLPGTGGIYS